MFHNVSFGPVSMLTWPVLGCLQHRHTSIGKMSSEGGIQRSFLSTARRIARAPTATYAALLKDGNQGNVKGVS